MKCPSCSTDNPPGAQVCFQCGAALAATTAFSTSLLPKIPINASIQAGLKRFSTPKEERTQVIQKPKDFTWSYDHGPIQILRAVKNDADSVITGMFSLAPGVGQLLQKRFPQFLIASIATSTLLLGILFLYGWRFTGLAATLLAGLFFYSVIDAVFWNIATSRVPHDAAVNQWIRIPYIEAFLILWAVLLFLLENFYGFGLIVFWLIFLFGIIPGLSLLFSFLGGSWLSKQMLERLNASFWTVTLLFFLALQGFYMFIHHHYLYFKTEPNVKVGSFLQLNDIWLVDKSFDSLEKFKDGDIVLMEGRSEGETAPTRYITRIEGMDNKPEKPDEEGKAQAIILDGKLLVYSRYIGKLVFRWSPFSRRGPVWSEK